MKRGNILLVALLVVGAVAASVGGYFWWKGQKPKVEPVLVVETKPEEASLSATETVNWKTYIDGKYQFSIKYPSTWTYEISSTNNYKIFFNAHRNSFDAFDVISVKENWSVEKEIADLNADKPYTSVSGISDTSVAGNKAKKFNYSTAHGPVPQEIVMDLENRTFIFNAMPDDEDFWTAVKTFKFL